MAARNLSFLPRDVLQELCRKENIGYDKIHIWLHLDYPECVQTLKNLIPPDVTVASTTKSLAGTTQLVCITNDRDKVYIHREFTERLHQVYHALLCLPHCPTHPPPHPHVCPMPPGQAQCPGPGRRSLPKLQAACT